MSSEFHIPVLSHEAVRLLINPDLKNRVLVDGTLGGGGYTKLICEGTAEGDFIYALDKDLNAIDEARAKLGFCAKKLEIINANFADVAETLAGRGVNEISGIVLDLGLSSFQIEHEDGFSYLRDTPLDMRAYREDPLTAADVLNEYSRHELLRVFEEYGEIGNAERLADSIAAERKKSRFTTTIQLAELVESEYRITRKNRMDFLSKIFQALRIEVNNEIENLKMALEQSLRICASGGRIVVVSYHSLEDRIVKNFFRSNSAGKNDPLEGKLLKILTKKPVSPGWNEIKSNRRSRSAKLRAAEIIQTQI
ncbi:MAG: 16S rRNA (cytosine(1402)-N(4))-methyltransferase RsmH [Ignavibacteria bacterium]|nr:16S rRNA (cytosine(1402)-N(4))-methyltransferase RsmH [Ignavibacteria bacterium]